MLTGKISQNKIWSSYRTTTVNDKNLKNAITNQAIDLINEMSDGKPEKINKLKDIAIRIQKRINRGDLSQDDVARYFGELLQCTGSTDKIKTYIRCCIVLAKHTTQSETKFNYLGIANKTNSIQKLISGRKIQSVSSNVSSFDDTFGNQFISEQLVSHINLQFNFDLGKTWFTTFKEAIDNSETLPTLASLTPLFEQYKISEKDREQIADYLNGKILAEIFSDSHFYPDTNLLPTDGSSSYIGPVNASGNPVENSEAAIFTFDGTYEDTTSPSAHNAIHKNANIPANHKAIFSGPGGSTTNLTQTAMGGLTGQNGKDGIDKNIEAALSCFKKMKEESPHINKIFIQGWSRGGVTAIIFANLLRKKYPDIQIICAPIDPVVGGLHLTNTNLPTGFRSKYREHMSMDEATITWMPFYAEEERSIAFFPLLPPEKQESTIQPRIIPLNHQGIVNLSAYQTRDLFDAGRPNQLIKDESGSKSHQIVSSDITKSLLQHGVGVWDPTIVPRDKEERLIVHDTQNKKVVQSTRTPCAVSANSLSSIIGTATTVGALMMTGLSAPGVAAIAAALAARRLTYPGGRSGDSTFKAFAAKSEQERSERDQKRLREQRMCVAAKKTGSSNISNRPALPPMTSN